MSFNTYKKMEFHISRKSRDFYQFDKSLFSFSGNVIFANFHASRVFAQKMNQKRDLVYYPEKAVKAGQINAMGLIDEILHLVVNLYREQKAPNVMQDALFWLYENIGKENIEKAIYNFAYEFPPISVYNNELTLEEYLNEGIDVNSNKLVILEEIVMLWLANLNPAFSPYLELFDDDSLEKNSAYLQITSNLTEFFNQQPTFGPDNQSLIEMLRSPAVFVPHSLLGQLEYIRQKWGILLEKYLYRLLTSEDLIKEEEKPIFGVGGQAVVKAYDFRLQRLDLEPEHFSPDKDWMPKVVLLAKNTYVWLDQLSKKYNRNICILSDIPDEELDDLAKWGFTGLWLIGIWERSKASKNIKIMRGNPDAVASAYSLYDYVIADDLGGEIAYNNLSARTWARGIRLSSDMVPNHVGIDSKWVVEHPDWFISLNYSPFPSYTFNGPNFSSDPRVGIFIEDHYFNNTDAAVVFKRVDFWTGDTKYIYHGNDGTSMPWNDTAQLNYLKKEVREAVIQTILHVARKFPIIRFDAAMTLAKKHYQRLWFPEPGSGGDIASRAEHGLIKKEFDSLFPEEFWREVVDRVALEVPDTLLLAEAFWLMEGFFVRTLGMHRVYNSAFMNMMRDEKNAEYRLVIKNTIEFDSEILKRYVNFMNNPDEHPAVDQFGKGDKYFGICTLMVTMPGLPMFGHGQIEGYTEKYGMEYRRSYWNEAPDEHLITRHIRDIFPLLRKRYLFADVRNFLLYDFFTTAGYVNEDVFAYSNLFGEERSLVVYHNKYSSTTGWIKTSVAYAIKNEKDVKKLIQRNLAEGLELIRNENYFTIFRDQVNHLEYIRPNREIWEKGLYIELDAYNTHVFLDFRQVQDNAFHQYKTLVDYLQGQGVPSINNALKEIFLQPIHVKYRELINSGFFNWIIDHRINVTKWEASNVKKLKHETNEKVINLIKEVNKSTNGNGNEKLIAEKTSEKMQVSLLLPKLGKHFPKNRAKNFKSAIDFITNSDLPILQETGNGLLKGNPNIWGVLLGCIFNRNLGECISEIDSNEISVSLIDEWLLRKIIITTFQELGLDEISAKQNMNLMKLIIKHCEWWNKEKLRREVLNNSVADSAFAILNEWLKDIDLHQYLGINRHQDVLWFNKESFEKWLWWMYVIAVIDIIAKDHKSGKDKEKIITDEICECYLLIEQLLNAHEESKYQVELLIEFSKKLRVEAKKTIKSKKPRAKITEIEKKKSNLKTDKKVSKKAVKKVNKKKK